MSEQLEGVGTGPQEGLFLVDGGVDPEVTSLFLLANTGGRIILTATVDIYRRVAEDYQQTHGHAMPRQSLEIEAGSQAIAAYPEFAEAVVWPYIRFRDGLGVHSSSELKQIEGEFLAILGGRPLTDAQRQQLSNLSDGDMQGYLWTFGLEKDELAFPLLDVGTGLHALFAQDVVRAFPGQRVVSTSMHLRSPNSLMSRLLDGQTDRGELIAADGANLPFEDNTFGTVLSRNADPYYVPRKDLLAGLREKHRVLKVGGTALLCPAVYDYGEQLVTQEDIAPLQADMDVSIQPIPESGRRDYDGDIRHLLVIRK